MKKARTKPHQKANRSRKINGLVYAGVLFVAMLAFIGFALNSPKLWSSIQNTDETFAQISYQPAQGPTNIQLTALDSTLRVNWAPAVDANLRWHYLTVRDGQNTLVGNKIVGPKWGVADMNGLRSGDRYTVSVYAMSTTGGLSAPITAAANTDPQRPMRNAVFFDNFNNASMGPLDPNYYDVRTYTEYGDTWNLSDGLQAFMGERHYHTQLIESQGQGGVLIRPRLPVNIADGMRTFQFETDMAPGQASHSKWWAVGFSTNIPGRHRLFDINAEYNFDNTIEFGTYAHDGTGIATGTNRPQILLKVGGVKRAFVGTGAQITPTNVRVPVVLKVGKTRAEMWINGVMTVAATGFTFPGDAGYWSVLHENYRSGFLDVPGRTNKPTHTNQVVHWDTIQFDDAGAHTYQPLIKSYIQPGCKGFKRIVIQQHNIDGCPDFITSSKRSASMSLSIAEDVSKIRQARILFSGVNSNSNTDITLNGTRIHSFAPIARNDADFVSAYSLTPSQFSLLRQGINEIRVDAPNYNNYQGLQQLELEVVYNIPKSYANPPQEMMTMLGITNLEYRFDKEKSPPVVNSQTFVYNSGADVAINYRAEIISTNTPWLQITQNATGTVRPIVSGGSLIPIAFSVDFNKYIQPGDPAMGVPGIIMITGVDTHGMSTMMNQYVAVLAVSNGVTVNFLAESDYTPTLTNFNKAAIPDYKGVGVPFPDQSTAPLPTSHATPVPTPIATAVPITPAPTQPPATAVPVPTQRPPQTVYDLNRDGTMDQMDVLYIFDRWSL